MRSHHTRTPGLKHSPLSSARPRARWLEGSDGDEAESAQTGDADADADLEDFDPADADAAARDADGYHDETQSAQRAKAKLKVRTAVAETDATDLDSALVHWIGRVADRDDRALTALYDATLSRVYALALRIVRRADVAEEVVEDTYFQVWRQAVRFDPSRGLAWTWLLGMARSRAIDALRREGRFEHASLDEETMATTLEGGSNMLTCDDLLETAREHADLHRALMLLQPQPRQLVALAFFRGMSHEEIASASALPLGTVKSQIRRGLLTLKEALGGDRGGSASWALLR